MCLRQGEEIADIRTAKEFGYGFVVKQYSSVQYGSMRGNVAIGMIFMRGKDQGIA